MSTAPSEFTAVGAIVGPQHRGAIVRGMGSIVNADECTVLGVGCIVNGDRCIVRGVGCIVRGAGCTVTGIGGLGGSSSRPASVTNRVMSVVVGTRVAARKRPGRAAAGPAPARVRATPIRAPVNTGIIVGMQVSRNPTPIPANADIVVGMQVSRNPIIDLTHTEEVAGGPRKRAASSAQPTPKRVRDADAAAI